MDRDGQIIKSKLIQESVVWYETRKKTHFRDQGLSQRLQADILISFLLILIDVVPLKELVKTKIKIIALIRYLTTSKNFSMPKKSLLMLSTN